MAENNDPKGAPPGTRLLTNEEAGRMSADQVLQHYGVKEQDVILDAFGEVGGGPDRDDPESRAAHAELVASYGGPEGFASAQADLQEAAAVFDVEGEWDAEMAIRAPAEQAQGIQEILAEYREALKSPQKAQALLEEIYSDPSHPYFNPNQSQPLMHRAVTRLWKAAHGEPTD